MLNFSYSIPSKYLSNYKKNKYKWVTILILALIIVTMSKLYWRKWGDIIIDFGREVYIPWQLSIGKVLYRDIDYVNGALAPYLNVLWFKIFGVSITTIFFSNLLIIAILVYIIYQLINLMCDPTTATLSCLVFLIIFAFPQKPIFNFVSPYDHNLVYGFLFAVLIIYCLFKYLNKPNLINICCAGFFFGLVFITKAEIFLATLMTGITAITIIQRVYNLRAKKLFLIIILFFGSMLLPLLLVFIYFSFQMSVSQAIRGVIGNWNFMFNSEMTKLSFYQTTTGLDAPLNNVLLMIMTFFTIMVILFGGVIIELIKNGILKNGKIINFIWLSLLSLSVAVLYFADIKVSNEVRIGCFLPLLSFLMIAVSMFLFVKIKNDTEDEIKYGQLMIWSVFSFFLLWKIIFHSTLSHYGFVLAIPGMLALVILTIWLIPRLVTLFWGQCYLFRKLAISCFIIFLLIVSIYNNRLYNRKTQLIGKGRDSFFIYDLPGYKSSAKIFNQMINYIETSIPAQASLLVLPEGAMINYLTRHQISIPLVSFTPGEFAAFGEPYIINSLKNHPPDFVVLVSRDFCGQIFGTDWGEKTVAWVIKHYEPVLQLGGDPLKCDKFGMRLLKMNFNLPDG